MRSSPRAQPDTMPRSATMPGSFAHSGYGNGSNGSNGSNSDDANGNAHRKADGGNRSGLTISVSEVGVKRSASAGKGKPVYRKPMPSARTGHGGYESESEDEYGYAFSFTEPDTPAAAAAAAAADALDGGASEAKQTLVDSDGSDENVLALMTADELDAELRRLLADGDPYQSLKSKRRDEQNQIR